MSIYEARFFHDWGSGIWLWAANDRTRGEFDYPVDHHDLGLPDELVEELDRLTRWRDTALNWDDPPRPGPWRESECEAFNAALAKALVELRTALGPDWNVLDESKPAQEDPDLDAYLADPDCFRRYPDDMARLRSNIREELHAQRALRGLTLDDAALDGLASGIATNIDLMFEVRWAPPTDNNSGRRDWTEPAYGGAVNHLVECVRCRRITSHETRREADEWWNTHAAHEHA